MLCYDWLYDSVCVCVCVRACEVSSYINIAVSLKTNSILFSLLHFSLCLISSSLFLSLLTSSHLSLPLLISSYLFLSLLIYSHLSLPLLISPYLFSSLLIYFHLFLSIFISSNLFLLTLTLLWEKAQIEKKNKSKSKSK